MNLSLNLTPRQAARVMEQAVRANVHVTLEPRSRVDLGTFDGVVSCREGNLLRVDLPNCGNRGHLIELIGAFCDARLHLDDELYLFTSNILDVVDDLEPPRLLLAIPEQLQVLNRRRFERTSAVIASQARLWPDGQPAAVGLLASVSASGAAINLPGPDADEYLYVGDAVRVNFEIAGFNGRFEVPATICNKSMNADRSVLTVGVEFAKSGNVADRQELARLQATLCQLSAQATESEGGQ